SRRRRQRLRAKASRKRKPIRADRWAGEKPRLSYQSWGSRVRFRSIAAIDPAQLRSVRRRDPALHHAAAIIRAGDVDIDEGTITPAPAAVPMRGGGSRGERGGAKRGAGGQCQHRFAQHVNLLGSEYSGSTYRTPLSH